MGTRAHVLMYHGFHRTGEASAAVQGRRSYSVSLEAFEAQLDRMARDCGAPPSVWRELLLGHPREARWSITFDDGLASALDAAEVLEARGWRGHFFVVSDWIGSPGYMTADQVRRLHDRGHVVGSHSATHPDPMSGLPHHRLVAEWRESVETVGALLGAPVTVASVPGGSLSRDVVTAAAAAGIDVLFTSEPVSLVGRRHGVMVMGRFTVQNGHSVGTAAALATGRPTACAAQWVSWNARKAARRILGGAYYPLRRRVLAPRSRGHS